MPLSCKIGKLYFILLFLAIVAYGEQQERVAIIQTLDNRDSIGFQELAHLTDILRETAVNVLPKQRYGVMTTESIIAFLGSQENARKVCNESSCLAEVGRKVNADYVAQARIGRFEGDLTIKTELYSSKSGNLIGSFTGYSKSLQGLRAIIDEKAPILFKQMIDESKPQNSETPVAMPPTTPVAEPEQAPPDLVAVPVADNNIPNHIPANVATKSGEKPSRTSFWVAIGLDVLGAVAISYAVYENYEMNKAYNRYSKRGKLPEYYKDARREIENNQNNRNTFYIIGGVLLASGIGVHIWF